MITNELEKLGFTPEEVKVYIALLETNGGFVSSVAKRSNTHRVTTYNTLANLQKKGFVRQTKRRGIRFYYPVNPQVILNQAENNFQTAKSIVPELIELQSTSYFKPKIQFFEGSEGVTGILDDLLESESEIIGYTNFKVPNSEIEEYVKNYGERVLDIKKKHRLLCPNDEFNKKYILENLKPRLDAGILEIFAVNPNEFPFQNVQYIYDNKVATISFDKDETLGVIIESETNAETNRAIFNLAWLGATSFVAR